MYELSNKEVALFFEKLAKYLEYLGENQFIIKAYREAASTIKNLNRPISDYLKENRLTELPHIGKEISKKIKEILKTKNLKKLQEVESKIPYPIKVLLDIPDLGVKRVKRIVNYFSFSSLSELKELIDSGKLKEVPTIGTKLEEKIKRYLDSL